MSCKVSVHAQSEHVPDVHKHDCFGADLLVSVHAARGPMGSQQHSLPCVLLWIGQEAMRQWKQYHVSCHVQCGHKMLMSLRWQ